MTESEALADALHLLAPAASGARPAVTPQHVNTAFTPQAQVWVIEVDAAPDSAIQDVPQGAKPSRYSHFTVVFDVKSHHWIEKYLW